MSIFGASLVTRKHSPLSYRKKAKRQLLSLMHASEQSVGSAYSCFKIDGSSLDTTPLGPKYSRSSSSQ